MRQRPGRNDASHFNHHGLCLGTAYDNRQLPHAVYLAQHHGISAGPVPGCLRYSILAAQSFFCSSAVVTLNLPDGVCT